MVEKTLHIVGPLLSETLLNIAQDNIPKGNINKGIDTYVKSLHGFTKEYAIMLLKIQAVLITNEDNTSVSLTDNAEAIKNNAQRIYDWEFIIKNIKGILQNLNKTEKEFRKHYMGDIDNYSIIDMMLRYFTNDQLKEIGLHTIAARILGLPDGKICDKGSSNPTSIWDRIESKIESRM